MARLISLIPESIFTWVSLVGSLMPPRDPNHEDDEEEGEDDDHEADEDREPGVIREPDEDKWGAALNGPGLSNIADDPLPDTAGW